MTDAAPTFIDVFGGSELDAVRDPFSAYTRLRRDHPVLKIQTIGGDGYLITRYDDVARALRDDRVFSNSSNDVGISLVMGRTIVAMDGEEHLKHRNIVTPALAPRALRGDFPKLVESIAHELIDQFADDGMADLVEAFTFVYPLKVFIELLGLPVDDVAEFHRWAISLTHVTVDANRGLEASQRMADYLRPVVEKRKQQPTDDLITRLVHAEIDGERMTEEEIVSFIRLLVLAGAETTYHLMGSTFLGLLRDPAQFDEVLKVPDMLRPALDEGLRWESPVQLVTRRALEDVEIAGTMIPAGSQVLVGIGSANRDESHFKDAARFDIHRDAKDHIAFGFGKHYCAGSRLAYLEAEIGMRALFERLPGLRLDLDQQCGVVGLMFRGPDRVPVLFDS